MSYSKILISKDKWPKIEKRQKKTVMLSVDQIVKYGKKVKDTKIWGKKLQLI